MKINASGVSQERAEHDLRIHERGCEHGQAFQRRLDPGPGRAPARSRQQSDRCEQGEEGLGQAAMDDRQRGLQKHDA